jgi:prepilin-type N-terminal cleavage/methylation domain-containing protein
MKNLIKRGQKGFTIIEILIVLAIAGLILAVVFMAVPQLQRNARDNQRQDMVARLKSELDTYYGNNNGTYPFNGADATSQTCSAVASTQGCNDWYNRYIYDGSTDIVNTKDPKTGSRSTIKISTATAVTWATGTVYISVGNICSGETPAAGAGGTAATAKQYAITVALDRNNTFYCLDNG